MRCTPEEKTHMLVLVDEAKQIEIAIRSPTTTKSDKVKAIKRLAVIVKEMKEFRKRYPDD